MNIKTKQIINMCLKNPDHVFKTWSDDLDHCERVCALHNLGIVEVLPQYPDIRFRLKSARAAKEYLAARA